MEHAVQIAVPDFPSPPSIKGSSSAAADSPLLNSPSAHCVTHQIALLLPSFTTVFKTLLPSTSEHILESPGLLSRRLRSPARRSY